MISLESLDLDWLEEFDDSIAVIEEIIQHSQLNGSTASESDVESYSGISIYMFDNLKSDDCHFMEDAEDYSSAKSFARFDLPEDAEEEDEIFCKC